MLRIFFFLYILAPSEINDVFPKLKNRQWRPTEIFDVDFFLISNFIYIYNRTLLKTLAKPFDTSYNMFASRGFLTPREFRRTTWEYSYETMCKNYSATHIYAYDDGSYTIFSYVRRIISDC